mgnify:CR=1 FL=1
MLSTYLQREGFVVQVANDSQLGLRQAISGHYELLVLDVMMPGLDGMALFDEIAKRNPGLPVVLMTAHGSIPEAVAATQRGVFGFLTKPLNNVELRDILQRAVHQSVPEQAEWREDIITRI